MDSKDCLHACMPGIPDTWVDIFYEVLRNDVAFPAPVVAPMRKQVVMAPKKATPLTAKKKPNIVPLPAAYKGKAPARKPENVNPRKATMPEPKAGTQQLQAAAEEKRTPASEETRLTDKGVRPVDKPTSLLKNIT